MTLQFKTTPYQHQLDALTSSAGKPAFALLMEMRTGKTKVVIDEAGELAHLGRLDTLVVVAPLGVHEGWIDQWNEHSALSATTWFWKGGHSQREQRELDRRYRAPLGGKLQIFTFNWDCLVTKKGAAALVSALQRGASMLVADESHRMKSPSSARTRAMLKLAKLADYRRILTGTPVANNPLDLWTQFQFLDPAIIGIANYYGFRSRYAVLQTRVLTQNEFDDNGKMVSKGRTFQEIVGWKHLDTLKQRIAPHSFTITAAECLGLPPRVYVRLPVSLNPEQRRLYDAMGDDLCVEYDGKEMSALMALTLLLRLQQINGGTFTPDESDPVQLADIPRDKALLDYLSDYDGKAIIWTRFVPERRRIAALLRGKYGESGVAEVRDKATAEIEISRFQKEPSCRYIVANPDGTLGEGRDLSMASLMVYYSNSFKLTARSQSEARCDHPKHKGGTPVTVVDLVATGTVDEHIVKALREKRNLASGFTGAELRKWITEGMV